MASNCQINFILILPGNLGCITMSHTLIIYVTHHILPGSVHWCAVRLIYITLHIY